MHSNILYDDALLFLHHENQIRIRKCTIDIQGSGTQELGGALSKPSATLDLIMRRGMMPWYHLKCVHVEM